MDELFDRSKFNVSEIARELYDFSKPGVIAIHDFVKPGACEKIVAECRARAGLFWDAPPIEGTTRQELKVYYCGSADGGTPQCKLESITCLRNEYGLLYKCLAQRARFWQGGVINSVGVHWYPSNSIGMGVHRDYTVDINLISSLTFCGKAAFTIYSDKLKSQKLTQVETRAGTLALMRGPRGPLENDYRPYHEVGAVKEERLTLLFRQKKTK